MRTLFKTLIILSVLLAAVSCTQYRFFPFPLPDEDDSTPYDVSTSESFAAMLRTGQVRLTRSISVSNLQIEGNKNYSIDLNGNTLTLNASSSDDQNGRLVIAEGANVIINGNRGTLNISIPTETNPSVAFIKLQPKSSLTLNNVTYNSKNTGILVDKDAANLTIINSTISAGGGYAVGTNASNVVKDVNITINGSTLIANNGTGLLFNIPSTLSITKSHIEGGAQALIVRGGEATIENSELVSNGKVDASGFNKYADDDWEDGNKVPYATLVVGNRGSIAYETEPTSCTVTNTSIKANDAGLNVYVASDNNNTVTFISSQYAQDAEKDNQHYKGANSTLNIRPF